MLNKFYFLNREWISCRPSPVSYVGSDFLIIVLFTSKYLQGLREHTFLAANAQYRLYNMNHKAKNEQSGVLVRQRCGSSKPL